MTLAAIEYLRAHEWSMGSGQCPDCCGLGPRWVGDMLGRDVTQGIGHTTKWLYAAKRIPCPLAAALESLGEKVLRATPAPSIPPPGRKWPDLTCPICSGSGIEVWQAHQLACACTFDKPVVPNSTATVAPNSNLEA